MKNVPDICAKETTDSVIKFQEQRSIIRFLNDKRLNYKKIQVDGCALHEGLKCDKMLCSADEREEHYVELKGSDVLHAIDQLRQTIIKLGEYDDKRRSYVVCTKVAPKISTLIQRAKAEFRKKYNSDLQIKETPLEVILK